MDVMEKIHHNLQIAKDTREERMKKMFACCYLLHLSAISQGIYCKISKTLCKIYVTRKADADYFILYLPRSVLKLILIACTKESKPQIRRRC